MGCKRAAIIKQGGLCAGGIEKYLQQIAIDLTKLSIRVDYFYTDTVRCVPSGWIHPGTDQSRKKFLEDSGVFLYEVKCDSINDLEIGGLWNNSNLFDTFNPKDYDVVIGGHKGEPCWPFSSITGTRIIETVHGTSFTSGTSQYANKYVLISDYQIESWKNAGGDMSRTHVIAPAVNVDMSSALGRREDWNIPADRFVFGMHQASRGGLFSPIPLDAYKVIQDESNYFVILGGTEEHDRHASRIGLTNYMRIPSVSNSKDINSFLSCLDVYSHGRSDGEVCSSAIIEAMSHGLPVVTHPSPANNGHISQIEGCGFLSNSTREYADNLDVLQKREDVRLNAKSRTKERYLSKFEYQKCKNDLLELVMTQ